MTEEQYWDRDCTLVIAYRKAEELRANRINQELWLQGAYIYDALCRVSPILHAFSKKGSKPEPYCSEPYSITRKQSKLEQRKKEKAVFDKGKRNMSARTTVVLAFKSEMNGWLIMLPGSLRYSTEKKVELKIR